MTGVHIPTTKAGEGTPLAKYIGAGGLRTKRPAVKPRIPFPITPVLNGGAGGSLSFLPNGGSISAGGDTSSGGGLIKTGGGTGGGSGAVLNLGGGVITTGGGTLNLGGNNVVTTGSANTGGALDLNASGDGVVKTGLGSVTVIAGGSGNVSEIGAGTLNINGNNSSNSSAGSIDVGRDNAVPAGSVLSGGTASNSGWFNGVSNVAFSNVPTVQTNAWTEVGRVGNTVHGAGVVNDNNDSQSGVVLTKLGTAALGGGNIVIPEPGTGLLAVAGLVGFALRRRRSA